jgi:hypothetical protein
MQGTQQDSEMVILFAEGIKEIAVFWEKSLDRLVCIPRNKGTRTRALNDFVSLCLEQQAPDTLGFQLAAFSHFVPRIWSMLGRAEEDRISLCEALHYYEALTLGGNAKRSVNEVEFQLGHLCDLRDRFGHVTIFQPDYARTIAL